MPESAGDEFNRSVTDAAYAAVGFGILGFQRAQVLRREMAGQLQELAKSIDEQVKPVRVQIEDRLDDLQGRLPEAPAKLCASIRSGAEAPEAQLRRALGLDERIR